ncbi:Os04g0490200 [Oryza sativa Japonica Group]|uniref:Os04g0490200 protein n=1 Tax=Oryza sativa subsp. japonica TaxID=39947 RepID=A0A0P0WBX0_ORYSJ|nr:Os04g0490200 [Oryza sativa Japonica Group]
MADEWRGVVRGPGDPPMSWGSIELNGSGKGLGEWFALRRGVGEQPGTAMRADELARATAMRASVRLYRRVPWPLQKINKCHCQGRQPP